MPVPGKVVMPVWCRIRLSVVMPRLSRGRFGVLVPGNVLMPGRCWSPRVAMIPLLCPSRFAVTMLR